MEDVDKILLNMIGTKASQNQYNLFKMKACWSEIAGKNNANHCIPVKLDRRIFFFKFCFRNSKTSFYIIKSSL